MIAHVIEQAIRNLRVDHVVGVRKRRAEDDADLREKKVKKKKKVKKERKPKVSPRDF